MLIPTDDKSFARDPMTGALVNTDNEALTMHKARRSNLARQIKDRDRLEQLELDMISLQGSTARILSLLETLIK